MEEIVLAFSKYLYAGGLAFTLGALLVWQYALMRRWYQKGAKKISPSWHGLISWWRHRLGDDLPFTFLALIVILVLGLGYAAESAAEHLTDDHGSNYLLFIEGDRHYRERALISEETNSDGKAKLTELGQSISDIYQSRNPHMTKADADERVRTHVQQLYHLSAHNMNAHPERGSELHEYENVESWGRVTVFLLQTYLALFILAVLTAPLARLRKPAEEDTEEEKPANAPPLLVSSFSFAVYAAAIGLAAVSALYGPITSNVYERVFGAYIWHIQEENFRLPGEPHAHQHTPAPEKAANSAAE